MAKRCEICGKGTVTGFQVSHSNKKSKRTWSPNVQKVKALVKGRKQSLYVCTRCLRSGKVQRAI